MEEKGRKKRRKKEKKNFHSSFPLSSGFFSYTLSSPLRKSHIIHSSSLLRRCLVLPCLALRRCISCSVFYFLCTGKNDEISPHYLLGKFWGNGHIPIISQRGNGSFRFPSIFHRNLPISLKFPPKNYGEILIFFAVMASLCNNLSFKQRCFKQCHDQSPLGPSMNRQLKN